MRFLSEEREAGIGVQIIQPDITILWMPLWRDVRSSRDLTQLMVAKGEWRSLERRETSIDNAIVMCGIQACHNPHPASSSEEGGNECRYRSKPLSGNTVREKRGIRSR